MSNIFGAPGRAAAGLFLCAALALPVCALSAPNVAVSIKPIHSLVAAITAEITQPELIINTADSPHHFALRPSQARWLERADLVIWVGPSLETGLAGAVETISADATVLALLEARDMKLLSRYGQSKKKHIRHGDDKEQGGGLTALAHAPNDPHFWLDPGNARTAVRAITAALMRIDPANGDNYRRNAQDLEARLIALENELERIMAPASGRRFLAYHDAYLYFERRFGVEAVDILMFNPDLSPGAAQLSRIQRRLARFSDICVFVEPQFDPAYVTALVNHRDVRIGELDPIGARLSPGSGLYFDLMRNLGAGIAGCLAGDG